MVRHVPVSNVMIQMVWGAEAVLKLFSQSRLSLSDSGANGWGFHDNIFYRSS